MRGILICAIIALFTVIVTANIPKCPPFNPDGEVVLLPNVDNCEEFYLCDENDKPILDRCGGGLWFNPENGVCDYPENVKPGICKPPNSESTTTKETTIGVDETTIDLETTVGVDETTIDVGTTVGVDETTVNYDTTPNFETTKTS